jgi:hypothetical protein
MVNPAVRWFSDERDDAPPFVKALAEVRRIGVHEGWCYRHVQAVICAIDMYAHAATGNPEYFWNKPHSTPGGKHRTASLPGTNGNDNVP